jgi:predicted nucleic acid-binding protein
VVTEEGTSRARRWLEEDAAIVTWAWTRVELVSAVERRFRQEQLTREERRACLDRFEMMAAKWDEVADLLAVRTTAIPLLARHALRAADAAQLAAALLVAENDPSSLAFLTLDERLSLGAEREGFRVP